MANSLFLKGKLDFQPDFLLFNLINSFVSASSRLQFLKFRQKLIWLISGLIGN